MNPIYDLIVIGVIVAIVLVNLHSSRKLLKARTTYWSDLVQHFNPTHSLSRLRPDPAPTSHGSVHVLRD